MKNNVLKKLATLVLVTIVTLCAIVATPMKAKAATIKEIYLVESEDKEYAWGFWQGFSGVMMDAEAASDWTYKFTKVQDGLYKINLSLTDTYTIVGASICVDGVELYKADANWSGDAGAAAWTSFTDAFSSVDKIYIALDKDNFTIKVVEAPAIEETEAPQASEDTQATEDTKATEATEDASENATSGGYISAPTTTTSNNSDEGVSPVLIVSILGVALVVVVIVIAVVSTKKKKLSFDDDDDDF